MRPVYVKFTLDGWKGWTGIGLALYGAGALVRDVIVYYG